MKWAFYLFLVLNMMSCSDQPHDVNKTPNLAPSVQGNAIIAPETLAATQFNISQKNTAAIKALRETARGISILNKHTDGRAAFKNILDAVEKTYPEDSYPVAAALNDYGFVLNITGATKDALPIHQRAVDIIRALPNKTPYEKDRRWRLIANLAETELRLNNIDRARRLYSEAYKIPVTLPWALPKDTTSGLRPLVIIQHWREQFKAAPEVLFVNTQYTADPKFQAEVFAAQDKGRYMDFGANPQESIRVWKTIAQTMGQAYHSRSRLATSALGNYGAISYFSDAKELGLEATLTALKQKEKFGTEFWFDAQNLSRAQAAAASSLINMNRASEAGPYVDQLRETLLGIMKGATIDMSLLHTLERDRSLAIGDYALAIESTQKMIALNKANPQLMDDQITSQMLGLAHVYLTAGNTVEAESTARQAMAVELAKKKGESQRLSEAQYIIGKSLTLQGRYFEANTMLRRAIKTQKNVLGEDQTHTGPVMMALANNLSAQGKHAAALSITKTAIEILEKTRGKSSLITTAGLVNGAEIFLSARETLLAATMADKAIAVPY